jgi:phosphatidate cytidylyltransferase
MLRWRLLLGTILIAVLVWLCWMDAHAATPGAWLLPVVLAITVLATKEILDLAATVGMRPIGWLIQVLNLLVVASPWMPKTDCAWLNVLPSAELCVTLPIFVVFLGEMIRYRKPGGHLGNLAASVLALAYVGLLFRTAVLLRLGWGIGAMVSWIVVVKMSDTGAYAVGRLIGRHKMSPLISPGKTIEGAFGALAFASLGSWVTFKLLAPEASLGYGWLVYGLLVGMAGILGDLAESLLKRDVGVKDSSTWLPGFGGVLDIVDSLLLSAPIAWFCWASGLVSL